MLEPCLGTLSVESRGMALAAPGFGETVAGEYYVKSVLPKNEYKF